MGRLKKFLVTEDRPMWVREFYWVDAVDAEMAEELYWDGDGEYLGHTVADKVEGRDACNLRVSESTVRPYMECPEIINV